MNPAFHGRSVGIVGMLLLSTAWVAAAAEPRLSNNFPPTEEKGGWPSLLPESGIPDEAGKAKIRQEAGIDWDRLAAAWTQNLRAPGGTGLLVIRHGKVVGEWYRGGDRSSRYNIFSSSKSYLSTAYGLSLADFNPTSPGNGRPLRLDDKVCNKEWLPAALPLPDPRKADITVRNFLQMASGLGEDALPKERPFEWALGHVDGSPFVHLKADPGSQFHYSNAGDAHLVLVFQNAVGMDLLPFLKERLLDPIGEIGVEWQAIGGNGGIGPFSQGFSGLHANPRQHARFCYLSLHRGVWQDKRLVPDAYYDFAWAPSPAEPKYAAQWWTSQKFDGLPPDAVMTLGRNCNDGLVVPSLDLVAVRLGEGDKFPEHFERDLFREVVASVVESP